MSVTMERERLEFVRQFPIKSFSKGETILYEGQPLNTIFAVQSGFIKVTSLSESGIERIISFAGPGNMMPIEQLFSTQGSLWFFYTALSDCTLYKVNKTQFLAYVQKTPSLIFEMARRVSSYYDDLLIRIDSVGHMGVRSKLIFTLCYLAKRFGDGATVDIYALGLKLTHQDISELINATRETTSIELHKLLVEGGVTYDHNRFVIDVPRLEALQAQPEAR
jgi:CRP-like cAMP-binding protein